MSWSPDGRFIAFARSTGENMEDRYVDEVRLLDVTTGDTRTLDVDLRGWQATNLISWSADSRSIFFAASSTGRGKISTHPHLELRTSGQMRVVRGDWPLGYWASGVAPGTNTALLVPRPQDTDADRINYDLTTGTIVGRFKAAAAVPNPRNATAIVVGDSVITWKGVTVVATDIRTGASRSIATLPEPAVLITLAPAPKSAKPPAVVLDLDGS